MISTELSVNSLKSFGMQIMSKCMNIIVGMVIRIIGYTSISNRKTKDRISFMLKKCY